MFCAKCGEKNADDAKFCQKCGAPLSSDGSRAAGNANADVASANREPVNAAPVDSEPVKPASDNPGQAPAGVKKDQGKIIALACAAAVLLIAVVIVVGVIAANASRTVNLNKYLEITVSGYDGYGNASVSIDWAGIEEKYGKKLSFTGKAKKEFKQLLESMQPIDTLRASVGISLDKYSGLTNGDSVSYTWNIDEEELGKYLKCKVKYTDDTYEIDGLTEVEKFDPFLDLEVTFTGIAPNGYAEYRYSGTDYFNFSCDKYGGLKNGDTVTYSLDRRDMEYYINNYGKIPEKLDNAYTVSGLPEYIDEYADLTEEFIGTLKSESEDTILANVASRYGQNYAMNNLAFAGYALLSKKDSTIYGGENNVIYMIYTGTVSSSEEKFSPTKVFYPVKFVNILSKNGELTYEANYKIQGSCNLSGWISVNGYTNPLVCYSNLVEAYKDAYNVECGEEFEKYSESESISQLADISAEYNQTLVSEAQEKVEKYISDNYTDKVVTANFGYLGEYLLIAKNQGEDYAYNNKLYVIFAAEVSSTSDSFERTVIYYPVKYEGVVKLPGGEYMVTNSGSDVQGYTSVPTNQWWGNSKGYTDGETMFADLVTTQRENYTYEVTEGLVKFGN